MVKSDTIQETKRKLELSSHLNPDISDKGYFDNENPSEMLQKINELAVKDLEKDLEKKKVIKPGFEQQYSINAFRMSRRQIKKKNREENEKTAGSGWNHLPASELTEEQKRDWMVLQMRNALNPKRFYKKNDHKEPPKYFQVGTIIETPADFYHARVPNRERKQTIVEELLADAEFQKYGKRKYAEALSKNPYYLKLQRKKLKKKAEKRKAENPQEEAPKKKNRFKRRKNK